jgi:hypothetical protein
VVVPSATVNIRSTPLVEIVTCVAAPPPRGTAGGGRGLYHAALTRPGSPPGPV